MKQLTLKGRTKDIPTASYVVDWKGKQGSKFSKEVLDFLYPYWKYDIVLAEWPVAGTKMRYDFVNLTRSIIVETDGKQHDAPSKFFHGDFGMRTNYAAQLERDMDKDAIAEKNGFTMVRIKPHDLPLSKEFFKKNFDIDL